MAYEHQPTRGPGVWVGAALLVAVADEADQSRATARIVRP